MIKEESIKIWFECLKIALWWWWGLGVCQSQTQFFYLTNIANTYGRKIVSKKLGKITRQRHHTISLYVGKVWQISNFLLFFFLNVCFVVSFSNIFSFSFLGTAKWNHNFIKISHFIWGSNNTFLTLCSAAEWCRCRVPSTSPQTRRVPWVCSALGACNDDGKEFQNDGLIIFHSFCKSLLIHFMFTHLAISARLLACSAISESSL